MSRAKLVSLDELAQRYALAQRAYNIAVEGTEVFADDVGVTLAYLLGAILNGGDIAAGPYAMPLMRILKTKCAHDDPIWAYVDFECHACMREICGCEDSDECDVAHDCEKG